MPPRLLKFKQSKPTISNHDQGLNVSYISMGQRKKIKYQHRDLGYATPNTRGELLVALKLSVLSTSRWSPTRVFVNLILKLMIRLLNF